MLNKLTHPVYILVLLLLGTSCKESETKETHTKEKLPNIVIIYLDDLGYGDVSYHNLGNLKTPNIDKLAMEGVRLTNGYATSATCTPSRYALLTGTYPWREKNAKILPGTAPLIIDTAQMTIPKMLKNKGYHTGIVGKWHLGLGDGSVDWNQPIKPGPNEVGFDYSYILAATQDRVPTVYIENGEVVNLDPNDPIEVDYQNNFPGQPTGLENPELLKLNWHHGHNNSIVNGIPRIGYMKGGKSALWNDETMADEFLERATDFVKSQKDKPFFLYYAMQQPHVPRTPNPRFKGATGLGPRGDAIAEADWCVGAFMKVLEEEGILENTLIIFSSDNGPVLNDGYYDDAVEKNGEHKPWGNLRGGKYSLFEAGTRVPFFVYWKNKIKSRNSDALASQVDLLSSLAKLVGSKERTKDSEELLDVFLGKTDIGRDNLVLEATSRTAYRKGDMALIPPYPGTAVAKNVNIELGNDTSFQLYNLKDDLGQEHNLAPTQPDLVETLYKEFLEIRGDDFDQTKPLDLK